MTNQQKFYARKYARETDFDAKTMATLIGCAVSTARDYIKQFRKPQESANG